MSMPGSAQPKFLILRRSCIFSSKCPSSSRWQSRPSLSFEGRPAPTRRVRSSTLYRHHTRTKELSGAFSDAYSATLQSKDSPQRVASEETPKQPSTEPLDPAQRTSAASSKPSSIQTDSFLFGKSRILMKILSTMNLLCDVLNLTSENDFVATWYV